MTAPPPVVALDGVQVSRAGRIVLDIPELAVGAGQALAVIGPNGAGKSTLLRLLGLVEAPTAGSVRFQGERVSRSDGLAVRRRMASVFQEPLLTDATVRDNATLGLRFRGLDAGRAAPRVDAWLTRLGIAHLASRQARTLSG
ncbi:MAG: ATP-binding cassette domain-containing protein, partial [Candidatus Rokuibacteriota bacterium]